MAKLKNMPKVGWKFGFVVISKSREGNHFGEGYRRMGINLLVFRETHAEKNLLNSDLVMAVFERKEWMF